MQLGKRERKERKEGRAGLKRCPSQHTSQAFSAALAKKRRREQGGVSQLSFNAELEAILHRALWQPPLPHKIALPDPRLSLSRGSVGTVRSWGLCERARS